MPDPAIPHEALPVFPLPGIVLFPGTLLQLHIFEPRYRAMLADCMAGARCMAMAFQMDSPQDGAAMPRWAPVAGLGRVVRHEPLADGRSNIVLEGLARVRLEEVPFQPPYRRARATLAGDAPFSVSAIDRSALHATVAALTSAASVAPLEWPLTMADRAYADLCAHRLIDDVLVRQAVLEELDPRARVRAVTGHLAELLGRLPSSMAGAGIA